MVVPVSAPVPLSPGATDERLDAAFREAERKWSSAGDDVLLTTGKARVTSEMQLAPQRGKCSTPDGFRTRDLRLERAVS